MTFPRPLPPTQEVVTRATTSLFLFFLCFSPLAQNLPSRGSIQSSILKKSQLLSPKKAIALTSVIEQSLRANYGQKQREYDKKILDLSWENTKDAFWMPQLQLTLTTPAQRLGRISSSGNGQGHERIPHGYFGLEFGSYTLFNWGKDYLIYLNHREDYTRSSRALLEGRRELKNQAIIKYFQLLYYTKVVESYRRGLRHSSFIYRYNREKVAIRKVSKQEYYQARSEYLLAQKNFQEGANQLRIAEEEMALLIADDPGTSYILRDELNYERLQMPLKEALRLTRENNPQILESTKNLRNAKRIYEVQRRENLPLPEISINLGAYAHHFGTGTHSTRYRSNLYSNDHNVDITATLNATWSLTGNGGFLNGRTTEIRNINRQRRLSELAEAKHTAQSEIQRSYYRIKSYEQQIKILKTSRETNTKSFDVTLENYLKRKTSYINFQDSLLELTASEISLAQLYYFHTREKILLSQLMGVDELPGKSFERLGSPKGSL